MVHPIPPAEAPAPVAGPTRPSPLTILLWSAWFGLISGALELAVFLLNCHVLDPRNYNVSRHYPWMFPAAGLTVVGGAGLVLATAARLRPRRVSASGALGALTFVASLGLLFRAPIFTAVGLLLAAGLAVRTARALSGRVERFDRFARRSLALLALLFAATVAACFGREALAERRALASARPPGAKNVILIVLDTVRAGSLGLYGYGRDTTPNLARIAARGVRFDRAYATAPWTAPSHASLFTGRWPHELTIGWDRPLDRSYPTLAEFLAARGYATAGFVANTTYCSYETGLARGFAHFEDYDVSIREVLLCSALVRRTLTFVHKHPALERRLPGLLAAGDHRKGAARVHRDFLAWLDGHPHRPFFAFINDYDAHHPYLPPEGSPAPAFGRAPETDADLRMLRTWWDLDKRRLPRRDVELARDAYDRCIASLDHQVGRLVDELERRGVLRDTLVILTADHGEHLGERDLYGHGCSVYLPELHVPLLVLAPGAVPAGRVVAEPVSLRDVAATVVDGLGLRDAAPFPGRSLARTWSGRPEAGPADGPILSEIDAPPEADPNRGASPVCRGPLTSLVARNFHYIRNGDGREELYDLERDPGEGRDLSRSPGSALVLAQFRATASPISRLTSGFPRSFSAERMR